MKKIILLLSAFFVTAAASAQMTVNGTLDSTLSMGIGAGSSPSFSIGLEEYANIRFQSRLRENGTFYGAINVIAAAGSYAYNAALIAGMANPPNGINASAFIAGQNYIAGFELERLYFRLNFETSDLDIGLFRLPFGYSQVWGSSDFLNPRNPLIQNARPRGILGTALSWYPVDDLKIVGFTAAPSNPFSQEGKGWLFGVSAESHFSRASLQALYSYETPDTLSMYGIHRAGLSVKADLIVSLTLDALYTYNHEANTNIDGLSASAGIDYSFFDGKLIVLAEYLYNGAASSTSLHPILGLPNRHYLNTSFTWLINDFSNMSVSLLADFDDISFTPIISFNHDLFQGVALNITAMAPLYEDVFTGNDNLNISLSARIRIRF